MKYLILILISLLVFSCKGKDNIDSDLDRINIMGNWYSIKNNNYQEYYFDENGMYVYSPYSGDVLEYNYTIKHDTIFRYFKHPELKNQVYEYYNKILKTDSLRIELNTRSLIKLNNENTLEMFINKDIDRSTYDKYGIYRNNRAIPLDSLMKKANNE